MRKIITSLSFVLIAGLAFAMGPISAGQSQLNVGLGLSDSGIPIYIGFDNAISNDVTLGAELSYRNYDERWDDKYWDRSITGISGNVNYHFNRLLEISRRWDVYAGLNVGFYYWSAPNKVYKGDRTSGLGLGGQIGARYYFTNKVGINLEFGGGNAFNGGKIGLTFIL